jgi:hypothetical protein
MCSVLESEHVRLIDGERAGPHVDHVLFRVTASGETRQQQTNRDDLR